MQRRWPTCPGITPRWAGCHPHAYRITISRTTHPRMGGENGTLAVQDLSATDSSPRGRGKLGIASQSIFWTRLIPARAGKTTRHALLDSRPRAHPRAGGENQLSKRRKPQAQGSSPRGRGKLQSFCVGMACPGLIPARAGKTAAETRPCPLTWAHPRAGGENEFGGLGVDGCLGSSPRGRGKHGAVTVRLNLTGLIPARAGKTTTRRGRCDRTSAHPRAGGENTF